MDYFGATWYQPSDWEMLSLSICLLLGPATLIVALVITWKSYQGKYPWWPLRIFWNLWLALFLFIWFCWWAVHGMAIISIAFLFVFAACYPKPQKNEH